MFNEKEAGIADSGRQPSAREMAASVVDIIDNYRTCEFATLSRAGVPQTVPVSPILLDDGRLFMATSIGLPQKAFNIRRNPRVSGICPYGCAYRRVDISQTRNGRSGGELGIDIGNLEGSPRTAFGAAACMNCLSTRWVKISQRKCHVRCGVVKKK